MKFNPTKTAATIVAIFLIAIGIANLNSAATALPVLRKVSFSLAKDYSTLTQLSQDADFILVLHVDSVTEVAGLTDADVPELKISGLVERSIKGGLAINTEFNFNMPGDLTGKVIFTEDVPPAPTVGTSYLIYSNILFPNDPNSNRWLTGMCGMFFSDGAGNFTRQGEIMPRLPKIVSLDQVRNSAK